MLPYCAASLSALVGEKQPSGTSNYNVSPIPELASIIADYFLCRNEAVLAARVCRQLRLRPTRLRRRHTLGASSLRFGFHHEVTPKFFGAGSGHEGAGVVHGFHG